MFSKILIANRGEIACRVIRTARRMGIATVAVYSDVDRNALHVEMADEAIAIGAAPARESYLRADRIVAAALATRAQAIHPGYGFLSENAEFADACAAAGVVFIGPPASAIRAMGSKAAAKALMERAGVPLVPGYHGDAQDLAVFRKAAAEIGYPVLIKASAGGGGKGMRVVETEAGLADALEGASRESQASFGDGRLLIEKYLTRPRHIEIQVFADTHGQCVSLFERDCSIQRRHQKVLEESPAPFMTAERRTEMGQAAMAAAQAVGYVGAGTVEFIAEGEHFFFMEMNTRLQVEHPVTEMVTGLDLVEWQLLVADGGNLPPAPAAPRGHAIEARIYAEDPSRDFLPSIGKLIHLRTPQASDGVRIDSGVREGDEITPFYDPMIAKLIVHAADRPEAVRKLAVVLDGFEIAGVRSNLALLRAVTANSAYAAGNVDTGFIGRNPDVLHDADVSDDDAHLVLAAAVLDVLAHQGSVAHAADPHSPWDDTNSWRLNGAPSQDLQLEFERNPITVRVNGSTIILPDTTLNAERISAERICMDGAVHSVRVVHHGAQRIVIHRGRNSVVTIIDPLAPPRAEAAALGSLAAPIPARVTRVMCAAGDKVTKGAVLLTLEAMKMELTIAAPFDGSVSEILHQVGDMVQEGTILAVLTAAGA
jgi:3-methylcrotonyl-CoA carboxylase alpha subunit